MSLLHKSTPTLLLPVTEKGEGIDIFLITFKYFVIYLCILVF